MSEEFGNAHTPPCYSSADEREKCVSVPKPICPTELKVEQAQVGQGHIVVLSKAGDVYAWGQGSEGEIGSGVKTDVHAPRLVMTGKGVADITVGRYHNICITEYGLIYSWGAGEHGQLGHGLEQSETLPRLAEALLDTVAGQIACGEQHTAALTAGRGMQTLAGCEAWRSQEESELRIKQQMVVSLPLGLGARELLSIGPTVRTYVDLFDDDEVPLKANVVNERDKEVRPEVKKTIVEETQASLRRGAALENSLRAGGGGEGAGNQQPQPQQQAIVFGTNTAADGTQSEDEEDDRAHPVASVGKLHAAGAIDDVSDATNQMLQIKTMTAKLKSTAQMAEQARQRAAARQAEEERQATEIAKAKLEGWAKRVFTKMDTNNDQRLTYNELKTGLDAEAKLHAMPAGLKFTDGKDIFVAIDTDHDGHVTEDEFIQEVIRVCDLKDVELFTANTLETGATGTSHLESDSKQGKGKCGMPAGMSMSSKGKARGKGTDALPNTPTLKPTPPPRIHDPKMRAADERVLIAFFAEFQPEFATKEQVQEIIHFYAKEQARKARISPMSNATAGGGDYRDPMRAEYRRQRGVDPWEWYESVRRGEAGSNSPKSAVDPTTRFARATGRATVGVRKQARARRAEYVQARNQQTQGRTPRPVSPESDDEATKKALKKITDRKPLSRGGPEWKSARRRAEGTIRPHTAVALSKDRKAAGRQVGPLGVGSAMTARTATPAAAIGGATGLALVLPDEPAPGTKGPGEPGQSPRIIQRAKSARLHRERREQMARSAHHAQSHISQLDRGIFKGVQDLRSKDSKAKDHWMALFSPLGPRFDFMRQAGELLVDSRRAMSQGRGATERSASRTISKISLLRSKLDQTKTALESKIKKLDSLKIEYANLVAAAALEDEALKAMHAEQARTSTLLETVHTRLMEASENHEELYSTQIYMKEHILSMQLIQQERSDELTAAKRLHSSLVALRERSEMMALGVMQEVKGLREDNATVRAQFQEALEQYTAVRKRSGDCVDQTQMIIQNRLQDRKAREERSLKKRQKAMRKSIGTTLNGELQKSQLTRARRYQQVFFELRELIGDIDVSNPADVDRIIEKCKSMGKVAGQGSSSHRLVNMSLLEDRQIATRRIEMLKNERDGLIELLRASFEITHEPGDENPDFYCVSPISYQLLYSEDPLLAAYENYTPVELLDKKGEAEWGFTDSTLVWSEYLGASHATHARRNGWLTWGGFKALRKQGVANIVNLEELRCGHPSRTLLLRNEAEHRLISRALELGAEEVQRRDRLQSEVHASLDVISMMKPLAIRARLWLGGDLQTSDEDRGQQLSQAQTSFYVLVFAIARELGLDPRENALPDLVGILQSALRKLELPSTMLGSFADIKAGKAPSMRDLVAHICHHPKIAIRTGWPEHAETERLDESLQAPRPVLLGNVEDDPHDGRSRVEQGNASATAPAVNSRADGEPESGLHAWTMGPEQVEPLSCLEDLEQALSCMMSALAAGERLQNALGKDQEHRLTRLMRQTEQDLARQAKRHPSSAITKATLRDYCLTGGEGIPDPSAHARVVAGALADASGQGPSSPSDVIDEAAHEVRKAELRAAYLAWDVVTVDLDTLLEDVQERKEARKRVQAPLYGSRAAGMRNTAPTVRTPPSHTGSLSCGHIARCTSLLNKCIRQARSLLLWRD